MQARSARLQLTAAKVEKVGRQRSGHARVLVPRRSPPLPRTPACDRRVLLLVKKPLQPPVCRRLLVTRLAERLRSVVVGPPGRFWCMGSGKFCVTRVCRHFS